MKHLFIINPAAGSCDRTESYTRQIQESCDKRGVDYRIEVSAAPGECTRLAREAAQTGEAIRIYACGGDGTLKEVAAASGTNMTYLSIYLNHYQHLTFYDYVNRFRVEEACHLIDEMSSTGRINMTEVAQRSGFNSVSTFNRNFKKTKGITPKEYYFK